VKVRGHNNKLIHRHFISNEAGKSISETVWITAIREIHKKNAYILSGAKAGLNKYVQKRRPQHRLYAFSICEQVSKDDT